MCRNSARSKRCDVNVPLRLPPSGFCRVGRKEGKASPRSPATQKKDYDSTVAGCWCSRKMPVRATILIPLSGPNPTAPAPSLFPMRRSGYRGLTIELLLVQNFSLPPKPYTLQQRYIYFTKLGPIKCLIEFFFNYILVT